jgi:3-dehydrosphinganine reductase
LLHTQHIFITGGSQGLGLALAQLVASKGADVTICSRSKDKLEEGVTLVKVSRRDYLYQQKETSLNGSLHSSSQKYSLSPSQKIAYAVADVSTFEGASKAIDSSLDLSPSSNAVGRVPDAVFCCAGGAKPGYFVQQTEEDFLSGFKTIYMTALSTSHVCCSLLMRKRAREAQRLTDALLTGGC